ncbi:MAG: D-alanyl-lipoteichoic acid biosynthesis protein DltD [Atopobiaceae bacterium]|nr:D-alanyl-lipoteichoic acid biosynthesis protein DltD [Atopobiaceae bacterium]
MSDEPATDHVTPAEKDVPVANASPAAGEASSVDPMLSRRAFLRLAGLGVGALAVGGGLAAADSAVPAASAVGPRLYDYAFVRDKFKSPAFALANRQADSILSFGSSEFRTYVSTVPQMPRAIFGDHDCGLDMWVIGEGYNQSLWHSIAFGAYAGALDDTDPGGIYADGSRKAVFIVSPQWFYEGGVPANASRSLFSYNLWHGFCANPRVSADSVAYARQRLLDLGVDSTKVWAGTHNMVTDTLNDVYLQAKEDYDVRKLLVDVRASKGDEIPSAKVGATGCEGAPDWDALWQQALADGEAHCTTNSFYIDDEVWNREDAKPYSAGTLRNYLSKRTFLKAPTEDADLDHALTVAGEVGLELLVVLLPVGGPWYDYEGFPNDDRDQRYALVRDTVSAHGTQLCDLSGYEYEPFFTCDGTHLGWTGWVAAEKAIYEFAKGA